MVPVEIGQIQLADGQPVENAPGCFLLLTDGGILAVLQHGKLRGQALTLFGVGLPVKGILRHPAGDVAGRLRRVDAEAGAEAGFRRTGAGQGDDQPVFPPGFVVSIGLLAEKHPVQNVKAAAVAGPDAEHGKRLRRVPVFDNFNLLPGDPKIHQIFHLREEQVLRTAGGIQSGAEDRLRRPGGKPRLSRLIVHGQIQLPHVGNGGKQPVQVGFRNTLHARFPPLSATTEGSQSSFRKSVRGERESKSAPA